MWVYFFEEKVTFDIFLLFSSSISPKFKSCNFILILLFSSFIDDHDVRMTNVLFNLQNILEEKKTLKPNFFHQNGNFYTETLSVDVPKITWFDVVIFELYPMHVEFDRLFVNELVFPPI